MVGWHHRLNGHEFEQAPGRGDRQGSLACCNSWGCKELGMTESQGWWSLVGCRLWGHTESETTEATQQQQQQQGIMSN